jgi:hypothetical protein
LFNTPLPFRAPKKESLVSISIGSNAAALLSYAGNAYGPAGGASKTGPTATGPTDTSSPSSSSSSTVVTLSDAAKAYLAQPAPAAVDDPPSIATLTTNARAWFDQQYASLGIASAMLDGQVAVDLSGQSRATLSAVADNAQSQFTADEATAAAKTLQSRFDDAMAPHVVIARHSGDYASLYAAASDYLDRAGADEKATPAWQSQKQAVQQGIAAASTSFGKAPVTNNADDPVRALLDKTSAQTPAATGSGTDALSANARAMLDAQAGNARDNGKELVFNSGRKTGQQVDFTAFNNRTLAVMALNADASFSAEEASAAKAELNQRSRSTVLNAFDPTTGGGAMASTQALLQQYSSMSAEEKKVLGFTDDYANRLMQNYRTMSSIQSSLGSGVGSGLASYF